MLCLKFSKNATKLLLKYGFCKKSQRKDAPATANPPKSDDKYAQKSVQLVRVSSFRSDFLQNPYFRIFALACKMGQIKKMKAFYYTKWYIPNH
jgi:hypothetical protein